MASVTKPLTRERFLILGTLVVLSVAAWGVLFWQSASADGEHMGLAMGMTAPLFLALWVVMMVAMMFPAAAPMILTFAYIQSARRERGDAFVPTWLFTLAYQVVWFAFGVAAFIAASLADSVAEHAVWHKDIAPRLAGALLVTAGLYQLSPMKHACLDKCRSPNSFLVRSWREGNLGALKLGLEHGVFCLGCCWLLFLILFPLGMTNMAILAVLTLVVFGEKTLSFARAINVGVATVLVAYGLAVVVTPSNLVTM